MTFGLSGAAIGGIAVGVGSLGSALIGANASSKAASGQINAANNATELQRQEWNQNQINQKPWLDQGTTAINKLGQMTSDGFNYNAYSDPSFNFTMQQGQDAMNRATANKGGVLSGSSLGALNNYSQNVAQQGYGQAFNRYQSQMGNLMSIAGLGQNAGAQLGSQGNQAVGNMGNMMTSGANAQAAGTVGTANQYMGALNNMGNTFNQYSMMKSLDNGGDANIQYYPSGPASGTGGYF